jgi:hypothetical protein
MKGKANLTVLLRLFHIYMIIELEEICSLTDRNSVSAYMERGCSKSKTKITRKARGFAEFFGGNCGLNFSFFSHWGELLAAPLKKNVLI